MDVTKTLKETLTEMQLALTNDLMKLLKSGSATAADRNVIRQLLKDNNITSIPSANPGLTELAKDLPTFDDIDNDPD